jgi:hypothetical protein
MRFRYQIVPNILTFATDDLSGVFTIHMTVQAVVFFGADGTGKTTQANLLIAQLSGRGFKTKKAWIRGRHTIAFFLSQILIKVGFPHLLSQPNTIGGKIVDTRCIAGKWIWALIEFVSVLPLIIRRIYIPLLMGYVVVAERYVVDTVVYNEFFIGQSFKPFAKILLRMIPKHSQIVHLDASKVDVISRRSDDVLLEDFVDYQLQRYRKFALRLGAITINTSFQSIDVVSERILNNFLSSN